MDWVFKSSSSSWDLSEPERDEFDVLVMDAFSVDSGILGDSTMASVPPPKKPRNEQQQQVVSSCLVDGCRSDLSSCREYHRRHRVCEAHSKTPVVAINGEDQRFCQQCSRFHSVMEFDEVKRSCRKRLDGHNRRRRKPRPGAETMYLSNYQTFFTTNHQPANMLRFGQQKSNQQLHWPLSSSSSSKREIKFPFLLGTDASSSSSSSSSVGQRSYNTALSLLSNNTSNSTFIHPHLPLPNYTSNNHLIRRMIHFQTHGL